MAPWAETGFPSCERLGMKKEKFYLVNRSLRSQPLAFRKSWDLCTALCTVRLSRSESSHVILFLLPEAKHSFHPSTRSGFCGAAGASFKPRRGLESLGRERHEGRTGRWKNANFLGRQLGQPSALLFPCFPSNPVRERCQRCQTGHLS